jgi:hypothetical protein
MGRNIMKGYSWRYRSALWALLDFAGRYRSPFGSLLEGGCGIARSPKQGEPWA